jgi:hypothetical protein
MTYPKDQTNPVFILPLVDQYGNPVTGVTAPTVYLSRTQLANGALVPWVQGPDFTWHELTNGEAFKGVYKLRQTDSPTVSGVGVVGVCALSVYSTDHDTAAGLVVYQVGEPPAAGPSPAAVADAVWDEAVAGHTAAGTYGEELHVAKAMLANRREHTVPTGVDVVKDNDGTTTLRTLTPRDGGDTIIVEPTT